MVQKGAVTSYVQCSILIYGTWKLLEYAPNSEMAHGTVIHKVYSTVIYSHFISHVIQTVG
jgi:hypothetical protein